MPINFKADVTKKGRKKKKLCLSQSKPELCAKQANVSLTEEREKKKCDE